VGSLFLASEPGINQERNSRQIYGRVLGSA
jgi:hypothetical protein